MANEGAYPLLSYRVGPAPGQPTIVFLRLQTEEGFRTYMATKEILDELGSALLQQAAMIPAKTDLS